MDCQGESGTSVPTHHLGGRGVMFIESASPKSQVTSGVPRVLVVVARDQPDLWRHLTRDFLGYKHVEVVLDRRHGGRWQWTQTREMQERAIDRRRPESADADLRYRAFLIVPPQPCPL